MPHHPALPQWQTLEDQIAGLQHLCEDPKVKSTFSTQWGLALEAVRQQLHGQMTLSSSDQSLPGKTQRHVTELHRLVRLSLMDVALWQGARSPQQQQQRFEQLRHRLAGLHQHTHAVVMLLTGINET